MFGFDCDGVVGISWSLVCFVYLCSFLKLLVDMLVVPCGLCNCRIGLFVIWSFLDVCTRCVC